MPVLNLNEDEQKLLVTALAHDRARRMHEWEQIGYDDRRINPDGDRWVIDGFVDAITDLRRKIEAAHDISKAAWQNEYGWLTKSFFDPTVARRRTSLLSRLCAQDNVEHSTQSPAS